MRILSSTWNFIKSLVELPFKIFFLRDINSHINYFDKLIVLPLTFVINSVRSTTDVVGPLALAKAVEIIANDEKDSDIFGLPASPTILLYSTVACYGFSRISPFLVRLIVVPTRVRINKNIAISILEKSKSLSYPDSDKYKNSIEQALQYSTEISDLLQLVPNNIHQPLLSFAAGAAVIFFYDYKIGLTFAGYVSLKTLSVFVVHSLLGATNMLRATNEEFRKFAGRQKEELVNADVIKVFNREKLELMIGQKLGSKYFSSYGKSILREAVSYCSSGIIPFLADIGVVTYMIFNDMDLKFDLQELLFLLNFLSVVNANSSRFIEASYRSVLLSTYYEEIDKIFNLESENHSEERNDERWLANTLLYPPSISFENVSFYYNPDQYVFKNLTFYIKPGQRCAIVGSSSSGKSTIANLLLRLYRPQSGIIKINDRDINEIPSEQLYNIISFLPQNTHLFENDTVELNVSYGFIGGNDLLLDMHSNPDTYFFNDSEGTEDSYASDSTEESYKDEIMFKKRGKEKEPDNKESREDQDEEPLLSIHSKIAGESNYIADAYTKATKNAMINIDKKNNIVPPKAKALSVGQKQRVSFARMLLRHSSVFVLDEATSALDNEIEVGVMNALKNNSKGPTMVLIAHRLNTIADSDKIIVLEKGAITQEGTHRELVGQEGRYQELWNLQMG